MRAGLGASPRERSTRLVSPRSVREPRSLSVWRISLGFGLGAVAAFAADLMDVRLRTLAEIRRVFDVPLLGMIPYPPRKHRAAVCSAGLISLEQPHSLLAESYKSVRTYIEFLRCHQNAKVILVTSPNAGDGKSTTASNLAISLAHAGHRVLLVDADLRRPSQHVIHSASRDRGLVQILKDLQPAHWVVQPTRVDNLDLISSGPEVPNPAELLTSLRLGEFLDEVRRVYDVVIIDSAFVMAVTDPSIIGRLVDGTLLVVRASATRRDDAERTAELLRLLRIPVLGVVVNGTMRGYGYYSYEESGSSSPHSLRVPERFALGFPTGHTNGTSMLLSTEQKIDESQPEQQLPGLSVQTTQAHIRQGLTHVSTACAGFDTHDCQTVTCGVVHLKSWEIPSQDTSGE